MATAARARGNGLRPTRACGGDSCARARLWPPASSPTRLRMHTLTLLLVRVGASGVRACSPSGSSLVYVAASVSSRGGWRSRTVRKMTLADHHPSPPRSLWRPRNAPTCDKSSSPSWIQHSRA
ncbi:hypothetical protein ZWY2020_040883 [Hordeum vulgare]|nr:hypothetical protein ZWY2020_040883 [Hordeum vulgare]